MTVLGKILVIVNFVFSLVAFGLIIFVHAASTNWHAQADLNAKALKVAQDNSETYKLEAEAARKDENEKVVKAKTEYDRVKAERDRLAQDTKDWQNRYQQALAQGKSTDSSREGVTAELARRKAEVEQMNALLAARDKRMIDLEKEKKELRDRAVTNEISARSEQERNMQLLAQLETMTKEIQRLQASGTSTGVAGSEKNPPPEDVEGVVKASDPQSGYITITIGSDAGLSKGNTLEVYRLKPDPKYLGTVRILDVRANEAVAKLVGSARRGQIQVGDHVSSNITARR
jgi:hypothetical protein